MGGVRDSLVGPAGEERAADEIIRKLVGGSKSLRDENSDDKAYSVHVWRAF